MIGSSEPFEFAGRYENLLADPAGAKSASAEQVVNRTYAHRKRIGCALAIVQQLIDPFLMRRNVAALPLNVLQFPVNYSPGHPSGDLVTTRSSANQTGSLLVRQ